MKRYDKSFREQALKLSYEVGVKKAAEQLGVIYGTLAGWRKHRANNSSDTKEAVKNPVDEIARLKKKTLNFRRLT